MAVSKALRGHTDISVETRRRVMERATELRYRPNYLPQHMLTGRTRTIGMVVPSLESTYFGRIAHGVTLATRERGFQLLLCNSEHLEDEERKHVEALLAHQVDGIILCPAGRLARRAELASVLDSGVPCVLAGRGQPAFPANFVGSDSRALGKAATEYLLDCGCRRVAHLRGPKIAGPEQRFEGYRMALRGRGLRLQSALVAGEADGMESGYQAMRTLLGRGRAPDGVFCFTDLVAGGAMQAILEAGLRIPEDIALIGVGNLIFSELLRVPLTTIDQEPLGMGMEAVALLLDLAEGRAMRQPVTRVLPFRLIVRESTRRPCQSA